MKNVLITGGTGFIGSNLAAILLDAGYNVRIFHRSSSSLVNVTNLRVEHAVGDVRDKASLKKAMEGCDTVFHTAAIVSFWKPNHKTQYDVNVLGTRNVVEACLESGVGRLVHTSSIAAVGYPTDGGYSDETASFNWQSVGSGYKNSKHLAEQEVYAGIRQGLNAVIVNPGVVIGPGDVHFNGGKIIRSIKKHLALFYIQGGMNIVYVGDIVRGHLAAALKGRTGERYILGGENLTHKQAFQLTAVTIGGIVPRVRMPLIILRFIARFFDAAGMLLKQEPMVTSELFSGAGKYNWYSSAKAERELGYSITPFREAVAKTYKWYVEQGLL